LEPIHRMDRRTKLFGLQRWLMLLEQLGVNLLLPAGLLVSQAM
jgi:hypothetical protein